MFYVLAEERESARARACISIIVNRRCRRCFGNCYTDAKQTGHRIGLSATLGIAEMNNA